MIRYGSAWSFFISSIVFLFLSNPLLSAELDSAQLCPSDTFRQDLIACDRALVLARDSLGVISYFILYEDGIAISWGKVIKASGISPRFLRFEASRNCSLVDAPNLDQCVEVRLSFARRIVLSKSNARIIHNFLEEKGALIEISNQTEDI